MPNVSQVRPKIWEDILDLYDDGNFSAIWGNREKSNNRELGVRWNGSDVYVGYPNQGSNPVWFSQPDFLARPILCSLLGKLKSNPSIPRQQEFIKNILLALQEA